MKTVFLSAGNVGALKAHGCKLDGSDGIYNLATYFTQLDIIAIEFQTTQLLNLPLFSNSGLDVANLSIDDSYPHVKTVETASASTQKAIDPAVAIFTKDGDAMSSSDANARLLCCKAFLTADKTLVIYEDQEASPDEVLPFNILQALSDQLPLDEVLQINLWDNILSKFQACH